MFSMKAARVNANLTQTEACDILGISKSTLIAYEKYTRVPSVELAQKMAQAYNLTIDDIVFFKG